MNIFWAEADKKIDVLRKLLLFFSVFQNSVYDRETEVTEVLENFTNLEKECEGAKQPVSVELQVRMFGFPKKQMISVKILLKLVYDIALGYSIPLYLLTIVTFGTFI